MALKAKALIVMREVGDHYGLKVREGRVSGHGTVPALAQIMQAFEAAHSDLEIPSYNYTKRDTSDRLEMARLAANRVQDLAGVAQTNDYVDQTTTDSLAYAEMAWAWFKDLNYEFPDGRVVQGTQRGVTVTEAPTRTVEEVEEVVSGWAAAVEETAVDTSTEVPRVDVQKLVDRIVETDDRRTNLALETVYWATRGGADRDTALRLGKEVMNLG